MFLKRIEDRATYKPDQNDYGFCPSPATHKNIQDKYGNTIHTVFRDVGSQTTIFFCHGRDGNLTKFGNHYKLLESCNVNYLIFDYPGYGKSSGAPSEKALYASSEAAFDYIRSNLPADSEIIIFGVSLGAAVAIELAKNRKASGLIVESPFTCTRDMGRLIYSKIPLYRLVPNRYRSIDKIKKITVPILFLHGTKDTRVPIEFSKKLFKQANAPKFYFEVPEAGHINLVNLGASALVEVFSRFVKTKTI